MVDMSHQYLICSRVWWGIIVLWDRLGGIGIGKGEPTKPSLHFYLGEFPSKNRQCLHCSNVVGGIVEVDDPVHQDAPALLRPSVHSSFALYFPSEEVERLVLVFCFSCLKENFLDNLPRSGFFCRRIDMFFCCHLLFWPVYMSWKNDQMAHGNISLSHDRNCVM